MEYHSSVSGCELLRRRSIFPGFWREIDQAAGAVDGDMLTGGDAFDSSMDADNGGNTVFAGDDGTVGHGAAHFHDQAARCEEEGGPTGIC